MNYVFFPLRHTYFSYTGTFQVAGQITASTWYTDLEFKKKKNIRTSQACLCLQTKHRTTHLIF